MLFCQHAELCYNTNTSAVSSWGNQGVAARPRHTEVKHVKTKDHNGTSIRTVTLLSRGYDLDRSVANTPTHTHTHRETHTQALWDKALTLSLQPFSSHMTWASQHWAICWRVEEIHLWAEHLSETLVNHHTTSILQAQFTSGVSQHLHHSQSQCDTKLSFLFVHRIFFFFIFIKLPNTFKCLPGQKLNAGLVLK